MARIITSVEIRYRKKDNVFVITTNHKDGDWEGSSSGAKVIPVDGYLVYLSWGSGLPLKVFKDQDEMIDYFTRAYACSVSLINK